MDKKPNPEHYPLFFKVLNAIIRLDEESKFS